MDEWTYTRNNDGSLFISRPGSCRAYLVGADGDLVIFDADGRVTRIVEPPTMSDFQQQQLRASHQGDE